MRLKSMELIGFKSFAQDTKITFPNGLIEIVGPNGSGKSNVVEAIRWALGEQSTKRLRSSKMSDVIFSGSKGHSALNRAKVTLVFDNRDRWIKSNYSELKVARKIYRNGDSFYYLNGKECRLRDIQNLFMNSGIGAGSFAIISQGQVEQIFKSKPEDRRFIIETAAGIYRYKAQKRAAQQKIKATDNNVARITDLVSENQRQLKHLNRQRNQAEKYLVKKRHYQALDNQRLILRWHDFKRQITKISHRVDYDRKILGRFNHSITKLQQHQRGSRHLVKTLQQSNEQLQKQLVKVIQRTDDYNNRRKLVLQKLAFQKKSYQHIYNQLVHLHQLSNQLVMRVNEFDPKIKLLDLRIKRLKLVVKKLSDSRLQKRIQSEQQKIEQLRSQYIQKMQNSARVDNQIHDLRKNKRILTVRSHEEKQRLNHYNQLISQNQSKYQHLSSLINRLQRQLKETVDQVKILAKRIKQQRSKLSYDNSTYSHNVQQFQSINAQRNGLAKLMANRSNLYRGARNLLKVVGKDQGILGPVVQFIQVPGRYVKAIETTLKSQLQQIIVTTPKVARKAIALLNAKRLGRVTFLPLHDVEKRWINQRLVQQSRILPGLVGIASELVTMPPSMELIKSHLLGNILIAKDLHSAIQISFNLHHRYRVVTLNGEVVNAGGAITGGQDHYEYHGILSQRYELHQLVNKLKIDHGDLSRQHSRLIQERQQFHHLERHLMWLQGRVNQIQQKLASKVNLKKHVVKEIKQQQREQQAVEFSFEHLTNHSSKLDLSELTQTKQRIKVALRTNELAVERLKSEVDKYQAQIGKRRQKYQDRQEELIRNQSQFSTLKHQSKINYRSIIQNRKSKKRLAGQKSHAKLLIQQLRNDFKTAHPQVDQLAVRQIRDRRKHCQSQLINNQTNLKKIAQQIYNYQNVLMKKKTHCSRLEFTKRRIVHQLNLIADQFRKRHIQVQKCSLPHDSLASLNTKQEQVYREIKQLGIVNLKSIREFSRVHHRYSFLHRQLVDLMQSQRRLSRAMERMNSTIKVRFKKTFGQINRAFYATYTEIFKGGHAKLELTDPKHLLTTGINIMAQPPGKRYRNMELLSGGERALTAIALLFAVIRVKPVPFCILDEAESALDLENVSRFAQYISRLKRRTQFIVITHRKETMLYADHLYGITMQQSGISTVISVNLDQIKQKR